MASFLGGQEKADVASLAKQAGNVSVWNNKKPNDKKLMTWHILWTTW
jgi:hypothetical protein